MSPGETSRRSLFVPGRLCLFGEHSDWAAEHGRHRGHCLVVGTDQGLRATATAAETFIVRTSETDPLGRPTGQTRQMDCPFEAPALLAAAEDQHEFFRYCAGVAHEMLGHPGVDGGLNLEIAAVDLPLKKGVASSAAVCILVAQAFDRTYGLNLFPHELMDVAYRGERLTHSQCGRMDQVCIYGKTPVLLTFERDVQCRVEPVFAGEDLFLFFVDLAGRKDTVRILSDLQGVYDSSPDLQDALGPRNESVVRQAYRALTAGDAESLGELMGEAQTTFDEAVAPHSPDQLAGPLLHEVLALPQLQPYIYGGKGVGSQGDGTAQFVARSEADCQAAMATITEAFPQMRCFPLTISQGNSAPDHD